MKKLNKYYVVEPGFQQQVNAGVLRSDNETILSQLGFEKINLNDDKPGQSRFTGLIKILKYAATLKRQSTVIFHLPIHSSKNKLLLKLLSKKQVNTVAIIVDIDGLRDKNTQLLQLEIKLLNKFNHIIAHNDAMKNFLLEKLPGKKIHSIKVFDYHTAASPAAHSLSHPICFAGNLEKSAFIYLANHIDINIYGQGFNGAKNSPPTLQYKGIFNPAILPSKLEGSFGLVWDGDSVEDCEAYLRFNNPHKFSLYLASGLPVITWSESAISEMIRQENIGFTVNTLAELSQKLKSITQADYQQMQQNAVALGKKITEGYFLKKVLEQI